MVKISVIVPIHGVEKYLNRCLDSLSKQSFKLPYEVLCINDTPNDSCPRIIDEFVALKPSVFKRIDVDFGNVSKVRNLGILKSDSEYIAFVDGDDFVSNDYLEKLYNLTKNDGSDIVVSNYYAFKNNKKKIIFTSLLAAKGTYDTLHAIKKLFNDISCRGYVWGKLFKSELIKNNNLEFLDVNRVSEDVLFTYMAFLNSRKISFTKERLYFYVLRNDSITSTWKKFRACQMVINSYALMKLYTIKNKGLEADKYFVASRISKIFLARYYLIGAKSQKYNHKEIVKSLNKQFDIIYNEIQIYNMPWEDIVIKSHLFKDIKISKKEKNADVIDISKA